MKLQAANRKALAELADFIEKHAVKRLGFNMGSYIWRQPGHWRHDRSGERCNTTACIAGWEWHRVMGRRTALPESNDFHLSETMFDTAKRSLGLNPSEAAYLFLMEGYANPLGDGIHLDDVTSEEAVVVLRHAADTGWLDWGVAFNRYVPNDDA